MSPFYIIAVEPKPANLGKKATPKLPPRYGYANQAEEWAAFARLFAADVAQRRRPE